jgi:NitT/TauT family transport system substrate-binding protein
VKVQPGGVGTPVVQMIASGQTDLGIVGADEVVTARARGVDIVALFAVYQSSPHGILVREERGFKSLADVYKNEGTLAIGQGSAMALYMQKKYAPAKVRQVPYTGGIAPLLKDVNYAQQGFVTSESLLAKRQGAKVKTFLVSESGFDPYLAVVAVRGDWLKRNEAAVKAFLRATTVGWAAYLKDPKRSNDHMRKLNPTIDEATFRESSLVQIPFIETAETKKNGLGTMSVERWKTLVSQLKEVKIVDKEVDPASCFRLLR